MINKKKPTALSQSVVLVLLGCIVLYTGTFIYEYVFLCDLEKYIHIYDQAAREKCARDGTFFDVQYHEGLYAYWRMSRSVQENALILLRVGSVGVFSYILFSSLSPKGPGSGGGSEPDLDVGPTSGLNSRTHQSVVGYTKLKEHFNIKDSLSSSEERSSLGLVGVRSCEPVTSFNSL